MGAGRTTLGSAGARQREDCDLSSSLGKRLDVCRGKKTPRPPLVPHGRAADALICHAGSPAARWIDRDRVRAA